MPKFKPGDRVRKDFRTGAWEVKEYDEKNNEYRIEQAHIHIRREYPSQRTWIYDIASKTMSDVYEDREIVIVYNIPEKESNLHLIKDEDLFVKQMQIGFYDNEIQMLNQLSKHIGKSQLPITFSWVQFKDDDQKVIRDIMYKQYWYTVGDKKKYGFTEFISGDINGFTVYAPMIQPLIELYSK